MMLSAERRRWVPVKRGRIYCSPGCGGGCTRAAFDHVTDVYEGAARALGSGWKARIWENLDWHGEAVWERSGVKLTMRYDVRGRVGVVAEYGVHASGLSTGGIKYARSYHGEGRSVVEAFAGLVKRIKEDADAAALMAMSVLSALPAVDKGGR